MAYVYNPNPTIASFLAKSDIKAHDLEHKRKLNFNINKYLDVVVKGKQQFTDLEGARKRAKNIKWAAARAFRQMLAAQIIIINRPTISRRENHQVQQINPEQ